MSNRWLGLILAGIAVVISLLAFESLPDRVATHWNLSGEADDWSSKTTAALFGPLLILGITALLLVLPRLDPRRDNYEQFRSVFYLFVNLLAIFGLVLHSALIATGLGWPINMAKVVGVAIGLLLTVMGNFLSRIKPNWFMGIRTPWTLESDTVWRKTHRVGGRLFAAAGLVVVAASLIGRPVGLVLTFVTIFLAAIGSVILSYHYWRQESQEKAL